MTSIEPVLKEISSRTDEWVERLAQVVAIKSVSSSAALRGEVRKMAEFLVADLKSISPEAEIWLEEIEGVQTLPDGSTLPYPPLVFAALPADPKKKTLMIYGHYDVQPADKSDGWDTEPFVLTSIGEEMRGRGSTDDKGPLLGWLNVLTAFKAAGQDIPVNLKFVCEGMEESGSLGFDETVLAVSKRCDFFKNIDYCCVSDNYWVTTKKPCLTYGLRGLTSCELEITGPKLDMHSGTNGGNVYQPMDDLIYLLSQLKDNDEKVLIPGIYDSVAPLTPEEEQLYEAIEFSTEDRCDQIGSKIRHVDNKAKCLMSVWRDPALTIHGIEGAFSEPGFKTVIPRRVVGKFSIRIVPNQKGEEIEKAIKDHLEKLWSTRTTSNQMKMHLHSGRWFHVNPLESPVFKAAGKAIEKVYNVAPDYTREGGSIPITLTLSELTGRDLCLLPMGRADDGAHAQNEKLDLSNYKNGMLVFANFLAVLAE